MSLPLTTREYYLTTRTSIQDLKQREASIPKLKATDVLVKIHAVSLQFRDIAVATDPKFGANLFPENLVPCSDMAGEVIAIGEEVTQWSIGDRVCANFTLDHVHGDMTPAIASTALGGFVDGVLTQYRSFPAHSLVHVPSHLSYEEGSTLPCAALTAYNALNGPVKLKAGDTVLIMGTGGVSIFGLQFAVASGATVIATSSSDEKLQTARKFGAKHLINYRATPEWDVEVMKCTNGRGVDHILEIGGRGTFQKSLEAVHPYGGWIHLIGVLAQNDNATSDITDRSIFKAAIVRGILVGSVSSFLNMNRMLEANPDTTRPIIDKVFPFDQAIEAFAHLQSQKHVGKVVIRVSE